ncbi:PIG-L deacetylase family protein [Thermoactinospora rubra]|uniref:PIG-L deacetylase family protein n=1 Tax=Thermoactinospora rubra TaxID=1088767 RepID=UPI000A111843|nr:PIG-L family deacetylase [Thermoactinospora rubra]
MHRQTTRLLVAVAHGDDETLGAGGTLAMLADEGVVIKLAVLTSDDGSRCPTGVGVTDRTSSIEKAAKILGIEEVTVHNFGDNRLDTVPQLEINRVFEREVREFRPDMVFTTSMSDLNHDHQLVSRAARIASRPGRSSVREIRCFEVRSATDCGEASGLPSFRPNCWQPLAERHLEAKLEALRAYGSEVESWPNSRSERGVRALAEYRGSQVATEFAEAFELVRLVL